MGTYERCFEHVRKGNVYGHAARNRDNIKAVRKINKKVNKALDIKAKVA